MVPLTELAAIDDLIRYELFLLLTQGKGYKICKNCGRPFIPFGRSDILCCDDVIIGANSVLDSDVEPYTIVVGNPARVLRKRFDDELIGLLLAFRWGTRASRKSTA